MMDREEFRSKLDEYDDAINAIEALCKPYDDARREVCNLREIFLEENDASLVGRCNCGEPLVEGDKVHMPVDDGPICEDCAPTYGECLEQLRAIVAEDPTDEEMTDAVKQVEALVAERGADAKAVAAP